MINIIEGAFAAAQIDQILNCRDEIFVGQDPLGGIDVDPQFLINLVTADAPKIIFFWIEKQPF